MSTPAKEAAEAIRSEQDGWHPWFRFDTHKVEGHVQAAIDAATRELREEVERLKRCYKVISNDNERLRAENERLKGRDK